jgi:5-methylcytosine-specific restriction protein A
MSLKEIQPTEHHRVIDLVREAGIDVGDWSSGKGHAASNPKYSFEWSFLQPGKVLVLNLWHAEMQEVNGVVSSELNLKRAFERETDPKRKARAASMDYAIATAFSEGLPVRVIVLAGTRRGVDDVKTTRASKRRLDSTPWAIASYDFRTGACTVVRGRAPIPAEQTSLDEELEGFEGAARMRFVRHRKREGRMRLAKLEEARQRNNGRLICEVPHCGFDFAERYGALGANYAQVHHLEPLSDAPDTGRRITLDKLAVVCANCHVMIHVGGKCRELDGLIPSPR